MTKPMKIKKRFSKISDTYSVTCCVNGYVIEVSGQDQTGDWGTAKYVFTALDELKRAVEVLAASTRS